MHDFFVGLNNDHKRALAISELQIIFPDIEPTGSRWICPSHATEESDWDVFFEGERGIIESFKMFSGWSTSPTYTYQGGCTSGCSFASFKKDGVNAIAIFHGIERWRFANDLCKGLGGPTDRASRVNIFKGVLYGKFEDGTAFGSDTGEES